jgi:hypothetical protein
MSVPAFVQSESVQDVADSVTTAPMTTTSGNFLVAMVTRKTAILITGSPVSDTYGNSWLQAWADGNTNGVFGSGALYYAQNIRGGVGHTVTFTLPSSSNGKALAVAEFTNIASEFALNSTAQTHNESGTAVPPILSGPLAGVSAGQLLIGAASVSHGQSTPASLGLLTDAYAAADGPTEGVLFSYAVVDAADTYYFEYTRGQTGSSNEGYGLATFKGSGIAVVQTTGVSVGSVASVTSSPVTTTSGNFLVVVCALFAKSFSGSPVTDSYGNTWTQAWQRNSGTNGHAACYYAENITGGAGHTVTLTPPGGNDFCAFGLGEFSGINTSSSLDQTVSASGTTMPYNSGLTATTSQADELLIGGGSQSLGVALSYSTVPGDWITVEALSETPTSAYEGVILAYQVAPADGTYEYGMNTGNFGITAHEAVGIASFLPGEPVPFVPDTSTITIRRMRRAPHLNQLHKRITYQSFELLAQVGEGLLSGQGSDPQICLRWSDDGGRTWSREHWTTLGKIGAYRTRVLWRRLGQARDRVFEISMSDPVDVALITAYLEANVGTS